MHVPSSRQKLNMEQRGEGKNYKERRGTGYEYDRLYSRNEKMNEY